MTAALSIAAVLAALALLLAAVALILRGAAVCLPAASAFLGDLQTIKEWNAQKVAAARASVASPDGAPAAAPSPRLSDGIAPPPVTFGPDGRLRWTPIEQPTSADLPPVNAGDLDEFDPAIVAALIERPLAPGSRMAQPPPGDRIEGER